MYKKRILVDLDGVLNDYGTEKFDKNKIPKIKNGTEDFLKKLSNNAELYLFTTREYKLAKQWLIQNKINKYFKDITNVKIPAFLHIDDRAICFNGDFEKVLYEVEEFKVYWKKS